jgi:hypothetical protein
MAVATAMTAFGTWLGASAATAAAVGTAATIGIAATAGSLYSSHRQREMQSKAQRVQQKSAQLQSARQAVQSIRGAQIARADILARGENQLGGATSSAVAGGAGSVTSQGGANIAFAQKIFGLQNSYSRIMESANTWGSRSQGIAQIGNLGMQLAGAGAFSGGGTPAAPQNLNYNTSSGINTGGRP